MSTVLRTKREFPFQGKVLPRGAEIDMRDFPQVSAIPGKWELMIDAGYFEDDRETVVDPTRAARRERLRPTPVDLKPDPGVPIQLDEEDVARLEKPEALTCGECGFHATSKHGLSIHIGRSHKKE